MILFLWLQLTGGLLPQLSPGHVQPTLTQAQVCATPYAPDDPSKVAVTVLWGVVLGRYGLTFEQRMDYLAAWVVPSSLGGVAATANVFPIPKASAWNLARKQDVERRVYTELCAGQTITTLAEAQQKAGVGWVTTWRTYYVP